MTEIQPDFAAIGCVCNCVCDRAACCALFHAVTLPGATQDNRRYDNNIRVIFCAYLVGDTGLELYLNSPRNTQSSKKATHNPTHRAHQTAAISPDLQRVIDAWPALPAPVRHGLDPLRFSVPLACAPAAINDGHVRSLPTNLTDSASSGPAHNRSVVGPQ